MLATYDLKTRARMYLWVTLVCGLSAAGLRLFLAGADAPHNYAERRLAAAAPQLATPDSPTKEGR